MRRARSIVVGIALALSACAIDTELGLDATIGDARVDVVPDPGGVVTVTMDVTYRVGEHAQESHDFMPQAIDVFDGDSLVVTMTPNRPPGFVPRLMPGQSFTNTFTGESRPGDATDPGRLCSGSARILFRWVDTTTSEIGMTDTTTSDIACF